MPEDARARSAQELASFHNGTLVVVGLMAKGGRKSAAAIQHSKLPDRAAVTQLKTYWADRLEALGGILATGTRLS